MRLYHFKQEGWSSYVAVPICIICHIVLGGLGWSRGGSAFPAWLLYTRCTPLTVKIALCITIEESETSLNHALGIHVTPNTIRLENALVE